MRKQVPARAVIDRLGISGLEVSPEAMVNRTFSPAIIKSFNDSEWGGCEVVVTAATVDSHHEFVDPAGGDLSFFKAVGCPVAWNHDTNKIVGSDEDIWRDGSFIKANTTFARHPFAQDVRWLVQDGHLKGQSIGAMPTEAFHNGASDFGKAAARTGKKYGVDLSSVRAIWAKWVLLEHSWTPIPSNRDAIRKAIDTSKREISKEMAEILDAKPEEIEEEKIERRRVIERIARRRIIELPVQVITKEQRLRAIAEQARDATLEEIARLRGTL